MTLYDYMASQKKFDKLNGSDSKKSNKQRFIRKGIKDFVKTNKIMNQSLNNARKNLSKNQMGSQNDMRRMTPYNNNGNESTNFFKESGRSRASQSFKIKRSEYQSLTNDFRSIPDQPNRNEESLQYQNQKSVQRKNIRSLQRTLEQEKTQQQSLERLAANEDKRREIISKRKLSQTIIINDAKAQNSNKSLQKTQQIQDPIKHQQSQKVMKTQNKIDSLKNKDKICSSHQVSSEQLIERNIPKSQTLKDKSIEANKLNKGIEIGHFISQQDEQNQDNYEEEPAFGDLVYQYEKSVHREDSYMDQIVNLSSIQQFQSLYEESFRNKNESGAKNQSYNDDDDDYNINSINKHRKTESFGITSDNMQTQQQNSNQIHEHHKKNSDPYLQQYQNKYKLPPCQNPQALQNYGSVNLMTPCFINSPSSSIGFGTKLSSFQNSNKNKSNQQKLNLEVFGGKSRKQKNQIISDRYGNQDLHDYEDIQLSLQSDKKNQDALMQQYQNSRQYADMSLDPYKEDVNDSEFSLNDSSYQFNNESSMFQSEDFDYDNQKLKDEIQRIKEVILPKFQKKQQESRDHNSSINQKGCKINGQVINNHNNFNLIYLMNKKEDFKNESLKIDKNTIQTEKAKSRKINLNNFM
eukprot:403340833